MALPGTMKALVQSNGGYAPDGLPSPTLENIAEHLALADIPLPTLRRGQVLIKVALASVNPSDIMFVQGYYGQPRIKGAPAGFEGVGTVVAGSGLYARFLKGRRVSFVAGPNGSGAWAEYAVADAATVIRLRRDVRDEDAAAMIVNPLTASAMVDLVPRGGAFIATGGASQLGKLMAGLARETGRRLISVARRDEPLAHLRDLGATHALNESAASFADDLRAAIKAEKPTVLLDAVAGSVSSRIFEEMGKDSRWIMYGKLAPEPPEIRQPGKLLFLRQQIEGFWLVTWMSRTPLLKKLKSIRAVQARFASGEWQTEVSRRITLKDVMTELPSALAKPDGKVMIMVA
ncbi:MAG: alcohol dehydrogenase catalytic domain-containing protein [Paracoccaceae bacterium]